MYGLKTSDRKGEKNVGDIQWERLVPGLLDSIRTALQDPSVWEQYTRWKEDVDRRAADAHRLCSDTRQREQLQ